jgi:hypothetical protein
MTVVQISHDAMTLTAVGPGERHTCNREDILSFDQTAFSSSMPDEMDGRVDLGRMEWPQAEPALTIMADKKQDTI